MHLMLGMSSDQILALGPDDNMSWMQADKDLFKMLTHTNGGKCFVSQKTFDLMPHNLKGRHLRVLTRQAFGAMERGLECDWWLLGGPTLAVEALEAGFIDRCFFTKISDKAPISPSDKPITMDPIWAEVKPNFKKSFSQSFKVRNGQEVNVQVWIKK